MTFLSMLPLLTGPPLILSYSVSSDGKDTVLSLLFFSSPFPKAPEWEFDNTPVGTRINFLQTTTYTTIQMRQHKVIVERPGFISNLTIIDSKYSGNFLVIVENTFGTVRQHIVVSEGNKGNFDYIFIGVENQQRIKIQILKIK